MITGLLQAMLMGQFTFKAQGLTKMFIVFMGFFIIS